MPGLPNELHNRCRATLLRCNELDGNAALRAVFVTNELYPFRSGLPEAGSKVERVDACLDYLLPKRLSDGRPVLSPFLAALRDRYQEGDALRDELARLVGDVQAALAPSAPPAAHARPFQPAQRQSTPTQPQPAPTQQPTQTITWLHLSDLHFRESHAYDENVVLKVLLRDMAERIRDDGLRPDFATITGDLAFSSKPAEYKLVRRFLDELLSMTSLPRERLFVVPGNHDVDRLLITVGAQAITEALTDRERANALLATPDDRWLVMARLKRYAAFVNDYFAGRLLFDDENYFWVRTLELAGGRIALLGLNSAWLSASDHDRVNGLLIGERQARAALEQAEGADLKIALLHHPFDWLREFDQNDSAAMLTDGCDFILHGHLHRAALTQLVSPDSGAMMIAGGACYETRQYPNAYNFVWLDFAAGTGTVYLRRYSDERGGFWAKDVLTYRNVPDGVYTFALPARLRQTRAPASDESRTGGAPQGQKTELVGERWNTAAIRDLLTAAFDDEELTILCFDHFRPVYENFAAGMGKGQKIQRLLDYCERRGQMEQFLAVVRDRNRVQHARFEGRLKGE